MGSNLSRMTSLELISYTECAVPVKLICILVFAGYWNQFVSVPK
jgi:hypothetical protein